MMKKSFYSKFDVHGLNVKKMDEKVWSAFWILLIWLSKYLNYTKQNLNVKLIMKSCNKIDKTNITH